MSFNYLPVILLLDMFEDQLVQVVDSFYCKNGVHVDGLIKKIKTIATILVMFLVSNNSNECYYSLHKNEQILCLSSFGVCFFALI